jgi:hypothetical protein
VCVCVCVSNSNNEKGNTTTKHTDNKRINAYYEQLYENKFINLFGKFLEKQTTKLILNNFDNLIIPVSSKENKFVL